MNSILLIQDLKGWFHEGRRSIFFVFCALIFVQLFFTYKQKECFPFLHFGMYSQPYSKQDTFITYSFYFNSKRVFVNRFADSKREMVLSSLDYYLEMKKKGYTVSGYEDWLSSYVLNDLRSQVADEFSVYLNRVKYNKGIVVVMDSIKVISRKYD